MQYIAKHLSKCKNVNVKSQVLFVKHTGWIKISFPYKFQI